MLYIFIALIIGIPLLTFLIAFLAAHKVIFILLVISLFIKLLIDYIRNEQLEDNDEIKSINKEIELINKELVLVRKNKLEVQQNCGKFRRGSAMHKKFANELYKVCLKESVLVEKIGKLQNKKQDKKDLIVYEQRNNKTK